MDLLLCTMVVEKLESTCLPNSAKSLESYNLV